MRLGTWSTPTEPMWPSGPPPAITDGRAALDEAVSPGRFDRAVWDACWAGRGLPRLGSQAAPVRARRETGDAPAINKAINATLDVVPGVMARWPPISRETPAPSSTAPPQQSAEHPDGRQIYFGIREFGMAAALNGMAAHGGVLPVGGTFFVFSDYCRPAVRLASLSQLKSIFVFTHDSVGLGEDGPTHQPIEHLASLRAMPRLQLIRPADANETAQAWRAAVEHDGPTALILTRQGIPVVTDGTAVERGAGVVVDVDDPSSFWSAPAARSPCASTPPPPSPSRAGGPASCPCPRGTASRPSPTSYRDEVLPPGVPRLSVEAAATFGWDRWVDASVGIDRYGASAPGAVALEKLGINVDNVVAAAGDCWRRKEPDMNTPLQFAC